MLIRLGYDVVFDLPVACPMLLMLYVHPSRSANLLQPDNLRTEPDLPIENYIDSFGNRVGRILAPPGRLRLWNETLVEDNGLPTEQAPAAEQWPVEALPPEVLSYLLASRYCEVDCLADLAWDLFKNTQPGWDRVQGVCNFVHNHLRFDYQQARSTRTAADANRARVGVCRAVTHLAITFCRALNIPARYATGYLGDIGVPLSPSPMDFSAWFEVFLGGRWYTFDARFNEPRIGRVLMARGRDAVDVALTTAFGVAKLQQFTVVTDEALPASGGR